MLYGGLRLTSQPSALANVKGVVYSIEFDVAPAAGTAHSTPYLFTRSEDFVLVSVVRKSDGSPLNPTGGFKFYPSNFQDVKYDNVDGRRDYSNNVYRLASQCSALGCVWYRAAFQYAGDGTGPVSLRFSCGCDYSGGAPEFCGSIDNIAIIHLGINAPSPKPTPAPSFQALGSAKPPLYLVINNEWGSNYGLSLFGGRELQFGNGNTLITGLKARCGAWASDETEYTLAARYGVSSSPWPFYLKTWPGYLTDGNLTTSMQLDAKKNKLLGVIYVDVTGVQFDRIVFFPLQDNWPTLTNRYTEDTNWGGSRIALVNSPDSPPIWQSSFPANTLMSKAYGGSGPPVSFTFYPFSSQLKCNAGSCIGRLNSTSSLYCFGSVGGTCPSTDCTMDIDCVKKYNLDASKPKTLWLGA
jgi:hypothetical protein